ncbi:MAG: exodeoxyribonuclease VII large subunit [Crocinitomicaceae bacterium]|nr:exodeoxyribonuclease VII large subunit [Crocinitomicaceae bacterium]|tara:strand:+ start:13384 stop:14643 length:1260 start_codon:yes stop_codon:yes gene_type:complete
MTIEKKIYTLYQLNRSIKNTLETKAGDIGFWVKAEIANITKSKTGHVYVDFVEEKNGIRKAAIRGTIWSSAMRSIKSQLAEDTYTVLSKGSEIVFLCRVTFHEVYGLSLSISEIDLSFIIGELERRKKETIEHVKKEGIDKLNKEKELPIVVHNIALIGSPGTSGFRDFAHHVVHNEWRFRFEIDVYSAPVQGVEAASKIIEAIQLADSNKHDAIVLVRGGGSPLDLDCFNNLDLAISIGNCQTPVLTGIGHENDLCVSDIVAHQYFKTPTDVGDFIVERANAFASLLIEIATKVGTRSQTAIFREQRYLDKAKLIIRELALKIILEKKADLSQIRIDLKREFERVVGKQKEAISNIKKTIKLLHPDNTLARGYSIVRLKGISVPSINNIQKDDCVDVQLKDGEFSATINELKKNENGK